MRVSLASRIAVLTLLGIPSLAAAEDAATTAPATQPSAIAPTTTAPESTPSATVSTPTVEPTTTPKQETVAATTTTVAAPPVEEAKPIPSYVRLDHDYMFGIQLWAGATYPITDKLGIASDIYVVENFVSNNENGAAIQSYWGEFDLGPALTLGPLSVTPMVGVAFDWAAKKAVAINGPQLYTVLNLDKIYFESWVWTVLYSAFDKKGPNDYVHTRDWVLYKLTDKIGLGPQLEYSYDIEDKRTVFGFPVGGHLELAYGAGNSLGLFLGYDTNKSTRVDGAGAAGRLTFVHNF